MQPDLPSGHIFQISISDGGVPKRAFPKAELGELGLVGDVQRHIKVHGGPERALCLYSWKRSWRFRKKGIRFFREQSGKT
jgi:MOSC domain-containing protein YiiM